MSDFKISASKHWALLFLSLFLINCTPTPNNEPDDESTDINSSIGWLHGNCIAIKNTENLKGRKLTIVSLSADQVHFNSTILSKATSSDECFALLDDRMNVNADSERHFYVVSSSKPIELAIGILDDDIDSLNAGDIFDFTQNVKKETFNYCSTSEGVNFSIWNNGLYNGQPVWSDYYYLGYDTEANCPELK